MSDATATAGPTSERAPASPSRLALWFGFLGAPVAWLVHLSAVSALTPVACEVGSTLSMHLATLVTGLVSVAAMAVARRSRPPRGSPVAHARFMSVTGTWTGVLFLALIVLEGLPVFVLDPCG